MDKKNTEKENGATKMALFASLGSALEYYDFIIYGMMAKYLSEVFFVTGSDSGIMKTFAIFAVGYLARPVGGTLVGMVADIYGRKKTFIMVMLIMSISTFTIGILPSYDQIGILAPMLMTLCRLLQGVSFGAELPGATTIVSEFSSKDKIGSLCSIVLSSMSLGSLLAVSVLAMLSNLFDYREIIDNGLWRIPFIIGGVLAVAAYYIRKNTVETPEFLNISKQKKPDFWDIVLLLKKNIINLMIGLGLTFFLATMVITNIYFPSYINKYFSYALSDIYTAMTFSMMASFFFMLLFGKLSDYFSKLNLILLSLICLLCAIIPLFYLLKRENFLSLQIFFLIYQLIVSFFFTSYLPVLSRLFTTGIRYTGTALTYNTAFAVASFIPTISAYFYANTSSPFFLSYFFIFATMLGLISVIALFLKGKGQYAY